MKANEAPEKLYVDTRDNFNDYMLYGFTEKSTDEDIEYTRTDAFIERAERYIRSIADGLDRDDDVEAFISGFIKYMEGE